MLSFDDACKEMERLTLKDQDDMKKVYFETQASIAVAFSFFIELINLEMFLASSAESKTFSRNSKALTVRVISYGHISEKLLKRAVRTTHRTDICPASP